MFFDRHEFISFTIIHIQINICLDYLLMSMVIYKHTYLIYVYENRGIIYCFRMNYIIYTIKECLLLYIFLYCIKDQYCM